MCGHRGEIAVKRMFWFDFKEDERPGATRTAEMELFRAFDLNPSRHDLNVLELLHVWSGDGAPPRYYEGVEGTVILICDLAAVPKENFEKKTRRDGEGEMIEWLELVYKLVLTMSKDDLVLSLVCDGKEYGHIRQKL